MSKINSIAIVVLAGMLLTGPTARAAEIEGVTFRDSVTVANQQLQLASLSRLYYKVIFTGAVAGLYLENTDQIDNVTSNIPKRLEFVYFGGLGAEDFVESANESLAENLDAETLKQLQPKIDAFNSLYVDIKKNDRYAISYIPGEGLQLALNDKVLGTVAGNEFANAYFRIWFGNEPFNEYLKETLLQGKLD